MTSSGPEGLTLASRNDLMPGDFIAYRNFSEFYCCDYVFINTFVLYLYILEPPDPLSMAKV